jgi:hypothetical protein
MADAPSRKLKRTAGHKAERSVGQQIANAGLGSIAGTRPTDLKSAEQTARSSGSHRAGGVHDPAERPPVDDQHEERDHEGRSPRRSAALVRRAGRAPRSLE